MDIVTARIVYPQALNRAVNISQDGVEAQFYAPNKHAAWRYKTMFIKEPETIDWLRGLNSQDVFWDVGANVGIYAIYAALVAGCSVVAIEPGAANYWTLCKNIELNELDSKVDALCIALGDVHKTADLYLLSSDAGGAQNALDRPQDDRGNTFQPKFRQGMISIPADTLVESLGAKPPTAIKIDVDGFELFVLRGAEKILRLPSLRRMSLEMDSSNQELVGSAETILNSAGLKKVGEYRSPNVAPNSPIHNFHFERA